MFYNISNTVFFNRYETESELWKSDIKNDWIDFSKVEECYIPITGVPEIKTNFPLKLIQRKGEIEIQCNSGSLEPSQVYFYSMQGELLFSRLMKGFNNIIIPTNSFSSGTYVVRIIDEKTKKSWTWKVIIL